MSYNRISRRICTHRQGEVWDDGCCHDVIFLHKGLNIVNSSFVVWVLVADYLRKHGKHRQPAMS